METLAPERQEQLAALVDELDSFPTYALFIRCVEAVGVDPRIEADQVRIDTAMAAGWAYDRMLLYLKRLRSLNDERMQLGRTIYELRQHFTPSSEADLEKAARARIQAAELSGEQEIVINFFCVSVQHIHQLLTIVAESVGYEIPANDNAYLDEFRHLRNHFEHWNERLPGKKHEVGLMTKTLTADDYNVRGGLSIDEMGRYVAIDPRDKRGPQTHVVDVKNAGMARIERIMKETAVKARAFALEEMLEHFVMNPDAVIPSPKSIRQDLPISLGHYEPMPTTTQNPPGEGGIADDSRS